MTFGPKPRPVADRLRDGISIQPDGCWTWIKCLTREGYGQMRVDQKVVYTHRLSYELAVGPIPDGLHIDHLCRNRACCNPAHLEPVSCRENVLRGVSPFAARARQTHCKRGHEFTPGNTIVRGATGRRQCRACRTAFWAARRKDAA